MTDIDMQEAVDAWIRDITYGIYALKNIRSSINADYFTKEQKEALTRSVHELKSKLEELSKESHERRIKMLEETYDPFF